MLILYGLGNNAPQYLQTKHNLGRLVIENLARLHNLTFSSQTGYAHTKSQNIIDLTKGKVKILKQIPDLKAEQTTYLLYSNGFMNNSGQPLKKFWNYYNLEQIAQTEPVYIILIHDDSDQLEGKYKFVPAGGSSGHRGVESVYQNLLGMGLNLNNIWRLKLGIRPENNQQKSETFVLKPVTKTDLDLVHQVSQSL